MEKKKNTKSKKKYSKKSKKKRGRLGVLPPSSSPETAQKHDSVERNVTRKRAAIEVKKKKKHTPWILKVALRTSGVFLVFCGQTGKREDKRERRRTQREDKEKTERRDKDGLKDRHRGDQNKVEATVRGGQNKSKKEASLETTRMSNKHNRETKNRIQRQGDQ